MLFISVSYDSLNLFCVSKLNPILGDHTYSHLLQTIMDNKVLLEDFHTETVGTPQVEKS